MIKTKKFYIAAAMALVLGLAALALTVYNVGKDAGTAVITVTRDTVPGVTAIVDAVSDTTPITDDTLDEKDETVALTVSHPASGTLVTPESATLRLWGRVTLENGTGLADAEIYYGFRCWHTCTGSLVATSSLVATTDSDGYYQANVNCPFGHDETLRVCAMLEGYTFVPDIGCWRSYGHCVDKETDFVASPAR